MFKRHGRSHHVLCQEVLHTFLFSVWGYITLKVYNYEKKLVIGFWSYRCINIAYVTAIVS